ncbi:MAG: ECF-type sigma factor [Planctomycetaceae bacterium]
MASSPADQNDSISLWLEGLKQGDEDAAAKLWDRCFHDLMRMAQRKFGNASRRVHDEEDAAVSVFASLCRGAAAGRFERLNTREDLWPLLIAITRQKVVDRIRSENRQKRGGGRVRGESVFLVKSKQPSEGGIHNVAGESISPELEVELNDCLQQMMAELGDGVVRTIAQLRLEGYTNQEIASRLMISEAAVRRKSRLIKDTWRRVCSLDDRFLPTENE